MVVSQPESPKVLLVANTDWYLFNFRRSLARRLRDEGWEVVIVAPEGEYSERIRNLGYRVIPWGVTNRGKNPLAEMRCLARLVAIYRREEPTLAHHFTAKCVLYGTIASYLSGGFPVVNAVTGLGYIFSGRDLRDKVLRHVVEWGFRFLFSRKRIRVIFQNTPDRDLFVRRGLIDEERTHVIRGSGVDCTRFRPRAESLNGSGDRSLRILFASRMLREKGVFELVEAGRLARDGGLDVECLLAGDVYPDNPMSLSRSEVEGIAKEPFVTYLGHVEDMPELISTCDVVALPSYYPEGTPRILLEAAATGKPIIATDIPGCRGVVEDGVNGILVSPQSPEAIARAAGELAQSPDLRRRMGKAGRAIVLEKFSDRVVLGATLEVYREFLSTP